jgi:hypothetical protein
VPVEDLRGEHLRRRGWGNRRGGGNNGGGTAGSSGGGARLLERLRELRGAGLRDLQALERGEDLPEGIALASARWEGNRPVAIVASRRDGLELLGWARIAARRAGGGRTLREVFIAAPFFSERTRSAAARAGELGLVLHLLSLPALADSASETFEIDDHPARPAPTLFGGGATLLARVLRVIEGAAAVTSAGGVRPAGSEYLVFVRGERVARVAPEGEGVAVALELPEQKQVHVTEANFPRWGVELHEWLIALAQDPRLLEGEAARRDDEIERAADEAHAGVTARWLPWNREGTDLIDWVGIDIDGRPVVGAIRDALEVADVPGLVAGWHLLDLERAIWTPGASGAPRLFVSAREISPEARALLEELAGPIGTSDSRPVRSDSHVGSSELHSASETGEPARADGDGFERGARRRRRRRRGRGGRLGPDEDSPRVEGEARWEGEGGAIEAAAPEGARAGADADGDRERDEVESERERETKRFDADDRGAARGWEPERVPESEGAGELGAEREGGDGDEPQRDESARDESQRDESGRRRGRRGRRRRGRGRFGRTEGDDRPPLDESRTDAAPDEFGATGEAAPEALAEREAAHESPHASEEDSVEHEVEATLAEQEEETERAPVVEPVEVPPPRARRSRAAIVVRDEPDSILAALVLARDRRTIVSFRVLPQEALMDFFKGPATDLPDNVDLLVVGFTAQPRPKEVLDTAELFRGRLQWFDHHDWAIEDVERLRVALGRDSILIAEDAASPLVAVSEVTERRSRFTDKLVDLSARRMSEGDMQKWGYRVIQLIQRMAANPGEHRAEIVSVLAGKPTDLPSAVDVYGPETQWVEEHDPRIVHFGEYQLAVCQVPRNLDPGEVGRRVRLRTGARLSLAAREGDDLVVLASNDEKRPLNVMSLLDAVGDELSFVRPKTGGDRVGRARVEELDQRPERIEELIGGIVRHRSILYG